MSQRSTVHRAFDLILANGKADGKWEEESVPEHEDTNLAPNPDYNSEIET